LVGRRLALLTAGMPSTVIKRFDYQADTRELEVLFVTGRRYRYREVPAEVAEAFRGAFAKGRYFNARIRDRFEFDELQDAEPADDRAQLSSSTSQ
jgi:hypothetical protein